MRCRRVSSSRGIGEMRRSTRIGGTYIALGAEQGQLVPGARHRPCAAPVREPYRAFDADVCRLRSRSREPSPSPRSCGLAKSRTCSRAKRPTIRRTLRPPATARIPIDSSSWEDSIRCAGGCRNSFIPREYANQIADNQLTPRVRGSHVHELQHQLRSSASRRQPHDQSTLRAAVPRQGLPSTGRFSLTSATCGPTRGTSSIVIHPCGPTSAPASACRPPWGHSSSTTGST